MWILRLVVDVSIVQDSFTLLQAIFQYLTKLCGYLPGDRIFPGF
jgi:hypothetical protein